MDCKYCGKQIPKDSKYCRFCGKNLIGGSEIKKDIEAKNSISSDRFEPAGFWIRLGAYIIDLLGVLGGAFAIGIVLGYLSGEGAGDLPDIFWNYFSYVIYNTFALTVWSTTLGKYMYGLKVVTKNNENLSFGQALKRSVLQPLSTLVFGVGYWNMNKNDKKQAWHDKRADTYVIRNETHQLTLAYIVTFIVAILWMGIGLLFS